MFTLAPRWGRKTSPGGGTTWLVVPNQWNHIGTSKKVNHWALIKEKKVTKRTRNEYWTKFSLSALESILLSQANLPVGREWPTWVSCRHSDRTRVPCLEAYRQWPLLLCDRKTHTQGGHSPRHWQHPCRSRTPRAEGDSCKRSVFLVCPSWNIPCIKRYKPMSHDPKLSNSKWRLMSCDLNKSRGWSKLLITFRKNPLPYVKVPIP